MGILFCQKLSVDEVDFNQMKNGMTVNFENAFFDFSLIIDKEPVARRFSEWDLTYLDIAIHLDENQIRKLLVDDDVIFYQYEDLRITISGKSKKKINKLFVTKKK